MALPVASFRNTCNLSHCNRTRVLAATHVTMCPLNRSITRELAMAASVAAIALLGYFLFPGHTYLQADTLIYVPTIERAQNPSLCNRADPAGHRPGRASPLSLGRHRGVAGLPVSRHHDFAVLDRRRGAGGTAEGCRGVAGAACARAVGSARPGSLPAGGRPTGVAVPPPRSHARNDLARPWQLRVRVYLAGVAIP